MSNIDSSAKISIKLYSKQDNNGKPFYYGKLQFNGTLSMTDGQSFMIFLSDPGCEELQIGPLAPHRNGHSGIIGSKGQIAIPLNRHFDQHSNPFYVGELKGLGNLDMQRGIFFTVFTSIDGREQLQLQPMKFKEQRQHA